MSALWGINICRRLLVSGMDIFLIEMIFHSLVGGFHRVLPIFAWNKGNSNVLETQILSKLLNRKCLLGLLKRSSANKSPVFLLGRMLLVTVRMGRRACQDMVLLHVEDALVG